MLNDVASRVLVLQTENTMSFGFITDTHISNDIMHHCATIAEFTKYAPLDFIAHGGDFIDGFIAKANELSLVTKAMNLYNEAKTPFVFCNGNHDDNNFHARNNGNLLNLYITGMELYNRTTRFSEKDLVIGSKEGQYYYKDDENSKIRTIFVNTNDIPRIDNGDGTAKFNSNDHDAYSNEQLNWIANTALNFADKDNPSDWGVIIIGHIAGITTVTNTDVLFNILNAFKGGTSYVASGTTMFGDWDIDVDFTSQGLGDFICFVKGDSHFDDIRTVEGFKVITTAKAKQVGSTVSVDTDIETAWDVYTINRQSRTINMTRFGAGEDRVTTY